MNKINTILIDDEEGALNTLRGMLQKFCPSVNVLTEARSPAEAVEKIRQHKPQLLLMDIEMPPTGTAFDVLRQVEDLKFGVIFITAYPQYAIDAINVVQPWAYLVKPFSIVKLQEALSVAETKISGPSAPLPAPELAAPFLMPSSKSASIVKAVDIIFCQSDGAQVELFILQKGEPTLITTSKALKDLEQELPAQHFFRTHHSYIVNFNHIRKIERTGRNGMLYMTNGMRVPISVQRMSLFETSMEAFLEGKR